jgi:hypothetical protein
MRIGKGSRVERLSLPRNVTHAGQINLLQHVSPFIANVDLQILEQIRVRSEPGNNHFCFNGGDKSGNSMPV